MNLRERYRPIALASNMLLISSFGVLAILLLKSQALVLINIAVGSAILLIGNMLFVASGVLTPGLLPDKRIGFPLNFTLPIVFSAWCLVVAYLTWRIGNPLEPTLEVFQRFAGLFETVDLVWFPVVQCAVLTVAALISPRMSSSQSVDSA